MRILLFTIFISLAPFGWSQLFAEGGYGVSFGTIRDLNKVIYLHNLREGVTEDMNYVRGGHGFVFAVGAEDGVGIELKWENRHNTGHSVFQGTDSTYRQDLKVARNTWSMNFYGVINDHLNLGMGVYYGRFRAKSRKYREGTSKPDYIEFIKVDGKPLSGLSGGFTFFGTLRLSSYVALRGTYFLPFSEGPSSNGLSNYMGVTSLTGHNAPFYPRFRWSNFSLALTFRIGDL